jgi:hypothetical protein
MTSITPKSERYSRNGMLNNQVQKMAHTKLSVNSDKIRAAPTQSLPIPRSAPVPGRCGVSLAWRVGIPRTWVLSPLQRPGTGALRFRNTNRESSQFVESLLNLPLFGVPALAGPTNGSRLPMNHSNHRQVLECGGPPPLSTTHDVQSAGGLAHSKVLSRQSSDGVVPGPTFCSIAPKPSVAARQQAVRLQPCDW